MELRFARARILPAFAAAGLVVAAVAPASADDASPWDQDIRSAARLIAASARNESGGRILRAGVEIRMRLGWKTYWRYPGDSGVPPTFDFSGSENLKAVTVLYPAPRRFDDGSGGLAIGYAGTVVLPLRVLAQDASRPVTLRLKLSYAVCEKLCVPAKAEATLVLSGGPTAHEATLAAAEGRVPRRVRIGEASVPSIRTVQRDNGPGKPRLVIDVAAPADAPVDLFAEGPTPDWALPLPLPMQIAGMPPGLHRFALTLDGVPPGAKLDGAALLLTGVVGDRAVEAAFRLD